MSILCEKRKKLPAKTGKEDGFAMLEVLVILMIITTLTATLYGVAGSSYQRTLSRVHEDEAYYAAIATVQLLAKEVLSDDIAEGSIAYELISETGMKKRTTNLVFQSEDEEKEIRIPVCIWSECDGERLLLAAEVTCYGIKKQVTLQLEKKEPKKETETETEIETEEPWVPVRYDVL